MTIYQNICKTPHCGTLIKTKDRQHDYCSACAGNIEAEDLRTSDDVLKNDLKQNPTWSLKIYENEAKVCGKIDCRDLLIIFDCLKKMRYTHMKSCDENSCFVLIKTGDK